LKVENECSKKVNFLFKIRMSNLEIKVTIAINKTGRGIHENLKK